MKILYLQQQDLSDTAKKIMDTQKKGNTVTVVDIRKNKNYNEIVDLIFSSDKIISW